MASLFAESFEGGSNGVALSTSNTGYSSVVGSGLTFTNSSAAAGTLAAQCAAAAGTVYAQRDHTASASAWYVWRVRLSALPSAATYIGSMWSAGTKIADVRINTDGTVTVRDNVTAVITSTGTALTTGAWHRIAVRVTPGGGATGLQLKVYLGNGAVAPDFDDDGTITATGTVDRIRQGVTASATFTYLFDDVEVDDAVEPDGYAPPTSTVLFEEDFEAGTNGAALSPSNSESDLVLGTAPTFTTTHHGTGALGMNVNASATTSAAQFPHASAADAWYVWRVFLPALPAAATYIWSVLSSTTKCADLRLNTDGTLSLRDGSSVVLDTDVALTAGAWHRLAMHVIPGVNMTLKIYLDDAVDADYEDEGVSTLGAALTRARFGVVASSTLSYTVDTIAADTAEEPDGGDGPTPPVSSDLIIEMFEGGTASATITTGNSEATAVTGAPTFATAAAVEGGLGARFVTSAGVQYLDFGHADASAPWYSFYIKVPTLPAIATYIGIWRTGATKIADLRLDPNGALVLRDGVVARITSTALLTAGAWHRVSVRVTPGTELRMRVYLGPNRHNSTPDFEDDDISSIGGPCNFFRLGITTTSTWEMYADRVFGHTATEPASLPPVITPVWWYEHETLGWIDVTDDLYYEHPDRGFELIDNNY
jgi:hypothetical protein